MYYYSTSTHLVVILDDMYSKLLFIYLLIVYLLVYLKGFIPIEYLRD